jgi:phosphate transport system substrate-binding protein
MKKELSKILYLLIALIIVVSCNADRDDFQGEKYESINHGKLNIHVEESLYKLMDSAFQYYQEAYPNIELNVEVVHARKAMALLLSGETEGVISARTFLSDEDSLMNAYDVKRPEMIIASDALVFYANNNFPLDTINDVQLVEILSGEKKFTDYFSVFESEPEIVSNSTNSSEFSNVQLLVLKNKILKKYFKTFNSSDSVINYVAENNNKIGIGYLSQIYGNNKVKALKVGFINKNGNRVYPQIVHQGFIIQEKYPYINKIRVYTTEERMNKPFWFASFISKEAVVQRYLKDRGIVPEFAKFKLIREKS